LIPKALADRGLGHAWALRVPEFLTYAGRRTGLVREQVIESLNFQLRKVTKNRGHFPNDQAVVKLLWLAICDIEDKRARDRALERGLPSEERRAAGHLVEGQVTTNWKQALEQLSLAYPDRINPYL